MTTIQPGRIPMSEAETAKVDELLAEHGNEHVTLSRLGNVGNIVMQWPDGRVIEVEKED